MKLEGGGKGAAPAKGSGAEGGGAREPQEGAVAAALCGGDAGSAGTGLHLHQH